jgi:hypothetical protein
MSLEELLADIEDVKRITFNPDDVILVRCKHAVSAETNQRIKDYLRTAFPVQEVVVVGGPITLDVMTPREATP